MARLSPATLRGYHQSFRLLTSIVPDLTLARLTPETLTAFFRRLELRSRSHRQSPGVKNSTVATYFHKLRRFFRWLQAAGHITHDPLANLPSPHVTYEDRKYLERSSVERIFAALALTAPWRTRFQRKRNLAMLSTLLYAGLRRGELLGLQVTDVNIDRMELTVRAETSKSRSRRVIPINSRLCVALEDYVEARQRAGHRSEYLFTAAHADRPLTHEGLKSVVEQLKAAAGVHFHLHQFRHTFAVNFLNQGGDVAKLKQLLGHRDIRMTSVYLRSLPTSAMRTDVESVSLETLL